MSRSAGGTLTLRVNNMAAACGQRDARSEKRWAAIVSSQAMVALAGRPAAGMPILRGMCRELGSGQPRRLNIVANTSGRKE
jgi:hypothetical protein